MMKSFKIEIPSVENMQKITLQAREEELQRTKKQEQRFIDDIPRFFEFITEQLKYAAQSGASVLRLNFDDEQWNIKDARIAFRFKGYCSPKGRELIEDFFNTSFIEIMGYTGYITTFYNSSYRLGEFKLSW